MRGGSERGTGDERGRRGPRCWPRTAPSEAESSGGDQSDGDRGCGRGVGLSGACGLSRARGARGYVLHAAAARRPVTGASEPREEGSRPGGCAILFLRAPCKEGRRRGPVLASGRRGIVSVPLFCGFFCSVSSLPPLLAPFPPSPPPPPSPLSPPSLALSLSLIPRHNPQAACSLLLVARVPTLP